jgi:hypothetical protein
MSQGELQIRYGESIMPNPADDIARSTEIKLSEGADPVTENPAEWTESVKILLGPLDHQKYVPIIRYMSLNYETHSIILLIHI